MITIVLSAIDRSTDSTNIFTRILHIFLKIELTQAKRPARTSFNTIYENNLILVEN